VRVHYNSPVVLTFALASAVVLVANVVTGRGLDFLFSVGPGMNWAAPLDYVRLFTYVLGHGSVDHLTGNMMMMLLLGPLLEEKYGAGRLLGMIAITAVVTGLLHVLLFDEGLMGASGVVFMMILLASVTNAQRGTLPLTFVVVVLLYLGREVVSALGDDNVSQFAHVLGGGCGAALGFLGPARAKRSTAS